MILYNALFLLLNKKKEKEMSKRQRSDGGCKLEERKKKKRKKSKGKLSKLKKNVRKKSVMKFGDKEYSMNMSIVKIRRFAKRFDNKETRENFMKELKELEITIAKMCDENRNLKEMKKLPYDLLNSINSFYFEHHRTNQMFSNQIDEDGVNLIFSSQRK